jgi:hypothetical protein
VVGRVCWLRFCLLGRRAAGQIQSNIFEDDDDDAFADRSLAGNRRVPSIAFDACLMQCLLGMVRLVSYEWTGWIDDWLSESSVVM